MMKQCYNFQVQLGPNAMIIVKYRLYVLKILRLRKSVGGHYQKDIVIPKRSFETSMALFV